MPKKKQVKKPVKTIKKTKKSKTKKKKSSFLQNLILFFVVALICFLMLEVATRILFSDFSPDRENEFKFFTYDNIIGWRNNPNIKGDFKTPDGWTYVTINSKGLRDKEYDYQRNEKARILVFGDSHVWGYGLNDSDIFTEVLEEKFNGEVEIINMGVSAYGTDQEFLLFIEEGIKYQPDAVILLFFSNDLGTGLNNVTYGYPKPRLLEINNSLILAGTPVPEIDSEWVSTRQNSHATGIFKPVRFLMDNSKFFYFISKYAYDGYETFLIRTGVKEETVSKSVDSPEWQNTLFIIKSFNEYVESRDMEFILANLPSKESVLANRIDNYGEILGNFSEQENIEYIDLTESVMEANQNVSLFRKFDSHMNEKGHILLANIFYEKLINHSAIN